MNTPTRQGLRKYRFHVQVSGGEQATELTLCPTHLERLAPGAVLIGRVSGKVVRIEMVDHTPAGRCARC